MTTRTLFYILACLALLLVAAGLALLLTSTAKGKRQGAALILGLGVALAAAAAALLFGLGPSLPGDEAALKERIGEASARLAELRNRLEAAPIIVRKDGSIAWVDMVYDDATDLLKAVKASGVSSVKLDISRGEVQASEEAEEGLRALGVTVDVIS